MVIPNKWFVFEFIAASSKNEERVKAQSVEEEATHSGMMDFETMGLMFMIGMILKRLQNCAHAE